jgi:hypothetical protein
MSIADLGSLGEFVASIAVVITLIFLAIQMRHTRQATETNTRALEAARRASLLESSQLLSQSSADQALMIAESERLAPTAVKFFETGIDSLDSVELFRLRQWAGGTMTRLSVVVRQHELGLMEEEFYEHTFAAAVQVGGPMWKALGVFPGLHRPGFVKEVERILDKEGGS